MQGRDKNIPLLCRGHSRPVRQVYHSKNTPDGFFIISACLDSKPMLREGKTGDWIGTFDGHKGAVWSAYVNNDVTLALTASADFSAKVWNAITGDELISFAHKHIVKTASFSREEDKIVTGGMAKTLQIFDLQRPDAAPQVLSPTCTDSIKTALYRPDGNTIVSVEDKLLRVWDVRTLTQVEERRVKGTVSSLAFTGGNDRLLSLTYAEHVQFLDPSTLNVVKEFGMPVGVNSASVHPDGNRFVIGGIDFYVYVYDYNSGEQLELHRGHHGPVHSVSYAPDGETYASGSEDGTIRIWQNEVKPYELWQPTGGASASSSAAAEATASASDSSTPISDS